MMEAAWASSSDVAPLFGRASQPVYVDGNGGRGGLAGVARCSIAWPVSCEPPRSAPAPSDDVSGVCAASVGAVLAVYVHPIGASLAPVKGRAPGSSEQLHRSGERRHGRSEPLMAPRQNSLRVIGAGEALSPRPSDSLAKGGIVRAEPLRPCSWIKGYRRSRATSADLSAACVGKGDSMSEWLANVTLGDLFALHLVLGLVQCAALGLIHGHQR